MHAAIADVMELYVRVGDLVKRDDVASLFKSVLKMTEQRMFRTLRFWAMEKQATLEADENGVITLPEDYLELRHVAGLKGMSLAALQARYERTGGAPRGYAVVGKTLVLRPAGGPVEAVYYARPESLLDVPSNEVLEVAPDLYLYGVAREMAINARDAELVGALDPLFTQALQALELEDLTRRFAMQSVVLSGPTP